MTQVLHYSRNEQTADHHKLLWPQEAHLRKELDGSGQGRSAGDQHRPLHLLNDRPQKLGPLGVVRLQSMALVANDDPKAATAKMHEPKEPSRQTSICSCFVSSYQKRLGS